MHFGPEFRLAHFMNVAEFMTVTEIMKSQGIEDGHFWTGVTRPEVLGYPTSGSDPTTCWTVNNDMFHPQSCDITIIGNNSMGVICKGDYLYSCGFYKKFSVFEP